MPDRKLTYKVNTDTSDAVADLRRLGTEGGRTGKALADGFDQAESAGTRALAALTSRLDDLAAETKGTAAAVRAIGAELGDGFDSSRVETMVADLRRMGVSFDEIETKARDFAAVIARADDIKLDAVNSGLTTVGTTLDDVDRRADNSRSVMANFMGNMTSELPGVAGAFGPLNEALGQFAEYATEGNIAIGGLLKAAGPIAGAAAAFAVLSNVIGRANDEQEAYNKRVADLTDRLREVGDPYQAFLDHLAETGEIVQSNDLDDSWVNELAEALPFVSEGMTNLSEVLEDAGLGYRAYARAVTGGAAAHDDFMRALDAAVAAGRITTDDWADIVNRLAIDTRASEQATADMAQQTRLWAHDLQSANEALGQFVNERDGVDAMSDTWRTLAIQIADGAFNMGDSTDALNQLREAFPDMSDAEIFARADEVLADMNEEVNAGTTAMLNLRKAADDAARIISSADWDAQGIAAAGDALAAWFAATPAGGGSAVQLFADYNAAVDNLAATLAENEGVIGGLLSGAWMTGTPAQREQFASFRALGETIMPRITQAFDQSNGSFGDFARRVSQVSDSVHRDLVAALVAAGVQAGDAEDQANALQQQLGLIPTNVTTWYELMGDAEAQAQLALLQSALDLLPTDIQLRVAALVAQGDFVAARDLAQQYLSQAGSATLPVDADPIPFWQTIARIRRELAGQTVAIAVNGARTGAGGRYNSSYNAAAPSGGGGGGGGPYMSSRPINVSVQAAVIGSKFDVERAVRDALTAAQRLATRS